MNTAPHTASSTAPLDMLQTIAQAICDRPEATAAQREARYGAVMATVQKLQPCGPVEVMLAGLAVTHAYLIEDAARDVCHTQDDRLKARTRSSIVALGRGMRGFLKELRTIQSRRVEVAVAAPDTVSGPDGRVNKAPVKTAQPRAAVAAMAPPEATTTPGRPVASLPALRHTETSVAAMMVALSPPMLADSVPRAKNKAVAASPAAGHAVSSGHTIPTAGTPALAA